MDRGAWWAAVRRVARNQTWLKRLSTRARKAIFMAIDSLQKHRGCGPRKPVIDVKSPNLILNLESNHFSYIRSFRNGN